MGLKASFDRLHHAVSMDSVRSKQFLDLALEMRPSRADKWQEVDGDYWTVTTPCRSVEDVIPGAPLLTIRGGDLELRAVVPTNADFPWQYRWEIFDSEGAIDLALSRWESQENIHRTIVARVENSWGGDRMEAVMAANDVGAILENYTNVIRGFTRVLQERDYGELSPHAVESVPRIIQRVEYLRDPEAFVASLTWRERRRFAYWRRSFDSVGAPPRPTTPLPSSLAVSVYPGIVGFILLASGAFFSDELVMAVGGGLLLPSLFFLLAAAVKLKMPRPAVANTPKDESQESIEPDSTTLDEDPW